MRHFPHEIGVRSSTSHKRGRTVHEIRSCVLAMPTSSRPRLFQQVNRQASRAARLLALHKQAAPGRTRDVPLRLYPCSSLAHLSCKSMVSKPPVQSNDVIIKQEQPAPRSRRRISGKLSRVDWWPLTFTLLGTTLCHLYHTRRTNAVKPV